MRSSSISIFLVGIIVLVQLSFSQGLRYERPYIDRFHPLETEPPKNNPFAEPDPALLHVNTTLFHDTAIVDFEKRQITFRRTDSLGYVMWEYHYDELSDYLTDRSNFALYNTWNTVTMPSGVDADKAGSGVKLEWELPVQYPSWAQRVLGKEPPKLKVDGALKIIIGYDDSRIQHTKNDPNPEKTGPGFRFEETSRFSIRGSVGRLININISANSDEGFEMDDPLKNFKIEYKEAEPGELEDEIVQEVIAGNTAFEMPRTELSGYSESHEGLFGIKIRTQLGPFSLTTIASHEEGEVQKKKLSGGGALDEMPTFTELEFEKNTYFFLDSVYRSYHNRKYFNPKTPTPPEIQNLQVWRLIKDAYRLADLQNNTQKTIRFARIGDSDEKKQFELLRRDRHYYLDDKEGWIRFTDSVNIQDNDLLAIYMRTAAGTKGDTTFIDSTEKDSVPIMKNLWVLKNEIATDSAEADSTFDLMWRHVYRLPKFQDPSSFKLNVLYAPKGGGDTSNTNAQQKYYSDLLGLTDNGRPLINQQAIYDIENSHLIFPPYDSTYHGNEPFANPKLGDKTAKTIYRYGTQSSELMYEYTSTYLIQMTGKTKKTQYNLGWNVKRGTEIVTADGVKLIRDRDYTIDYDMGQLNLISPRATSANNVGIEYQQDALFIPEKKVFLGARGELKLPFIGDNSFVGTSILYQSASSNKDIPQIDQEPYSILLLDANTSIDFSPMWMSSLVNMLPLVKTDAPSSAVFDFEIAHSRMDPNTEHQAYIDNFESSKRALSLGGSYGLWKPASFPFGDDSLLVHRPPAWDFYWFNPVNDDKQHRVHKDSIEIPDDDRYVAGESKYAHVLRLHTKPAPDNPEYQKRFKNAWAGIMSYNPTSIADFSRDRYLEFRMKVETNTKGKLIIQMGEMREDLPTNGGPPNRVGDYEDTTLIRSTLNYTDPNLDLGLDQTPDSLEYYLLPNADGTGWDTLTYDSPLLRNPKDPAGDNYREYDNNNVNNYRYVNGTQGDGHLTSEDINYSGAVETSLKEQFFQFTIDLNDTNFIDKTTKLVSGSGWRQYRIPLKENIEGLHFRDTINNPSWKRITMVRLVVTDFDSTQLTREHKILLSDMEVVGNEWEAIVDSLGDIKIEPSVISSDDNRQYELSLNQTNRIYREREATGNQLAREQSLKLNFKDIYPGDVALVKRNLTYRPQNLTAYEHLTLLVHGDGNAPYDNQTRFVFRFGTDDSTYYEYSRIINRGWNNYISIDLKELSKMKLAYIQSHGENAPIDTSIALNASERLGIHTPQGRQANLSNIIWMAVGVAREPSAGNWPVKGEVWVNEMKVTGIRQLNGWAGRVQFTTEWADFLTIGATVNYEGGDFRRMTENSVKTDYSSLSGAFHARTSFDKFLPQEWGVSIPVGGSINGSLTRPQLKQNTDIYLTENGKPDGFTDMVNDAANMVVGDDVFESDTTVSEPYQEQSVSHTLYTNFKKNRNSTNPFVNFTADRISTNLDYNMTARKTGLGQGRNQLTDSIESYFAIDTTTSYHGKLGYDLTPNNPPSWTKWRPLETEKSPKWVPTPMRGYEFSLLPSRINFDLADVYYTWTRSHEKREMLPTTYAQNRDFDIGHGFGLNYSPVSPLLTIGYDLNMSRNLRDVAGQKMNIMIDSVFRMHDAWDDYLYLYGEHTRDQRLSLNLNPKFTNWLTHRADYSVDANNRVNNIGQDSTDYLNIGIKGTFNLNSSIDIGTFFNSISTSFGSESGIGSFFAKMKKSIDNIELRSISYTYSGTSNLQNKNMNTEFLSNTGTSTFDFAMYQFGFKDRNLWNIVTGNMNDNKFGGMNFRKGIDVDNLYREDERSVSQTHRFSSSFMLPKPLELRFTQLYYGWSKSFIARPDTSRRDTTHTFPDFGIGGNTPVLEQATFIKRVLESISISSSFSYRKVNIVNSLSPTDETSIAKNWSPLFGFDGKVKKWPIHFNYDHNYSTNQQWGQDTSVTTTHDDEVGVSYEIDQASSLSEIRLFKWTIPVRGRTSMGLKGSRNSTRTETNDIESNTVNTFSLGPHLSYVFTDNVTGTLEYQYSRNDDNNVITTTNLFELIVEITF